tara:strand:- start:353 stop:526 length:174 start_codon:yes stop_codon:yes gene_type:complete
VIVILGDVNQQVHVVEFSINELKTVTLTSPGVRPDNQHVETTIDLANAGQNRVWGIG